MKSEACWLIQWLRPITIQPSRALWNCTSSPARLMSLPIVSRMLLSPINVAVTSGMSMNVQGHGNTQAQTFHDTPFLVHSTMNHPVNTVDRARPRLCVHIVSEAHTSLARAHSLGQHFPATLPWLRCFAKPELFVLEKPMSVTAFGTAGNNVEYWGSAGRNLNRDKSLPARDGTRGRRSWYEMGTRTSRIETFASV